MECASLSGIGRAMSGADFGVRFLRQNFAVSSHCDTPHLSEPAMSPLLQEHSRSTPWCAQI